MEMEYDVFKCCPRLKKHMLIIFSGRSLIRAFGAAMTWKGIFERGVYVIHKATRSYATLPLGKYTIAASRDHKQEMSSRKTYFLIRMLILLNFWAKTAKGAGGGRRRRKLLCVTTQLSEGGGRQQQKCFSSSCPKEQQQKDNNKRCNSNYIATTTTRTAATTVNCCSQFA